MRSGRVSHAQPVMCLSLLWLFLAGCQDADSSGRWVGTVRDSAGVEVVANPSEGMWAPAEGWRVEQLLAIGGLDADEPAQFGDISGLDVDATGSIYIADAQVSTVRVFDSTGRYVRSIGQAGSGPGELGGSVAGVFVDEDQLVVPDLSSQRITRFSLDGTLMSDQRLDMSRGIPIRFDMLGPGRLVAQRRLQVPGEEVATGGDPIVTLPSAGEQADTVARLGLGQSVQITGGIPKIRAFAPDPVWDAAPSGRLATAMTSGWRFRVYGADGSLERIITRAFDRRSVTARDRQEVREGLEEMYASQGVPPELVDQVISEMEFGDHLPAFAAIAVGPEDSLWVQRLASDEELAARGASVDVAEMGSREWGVFNAEGRFLGLVSFPVRFRPMRVIEDRFFGVAEDDVGVQSVRVFRIATD